MLLLHPTQLWSLLGRFTGLAAWSRVITSIKRLGLQVFLLFFSTVSFSFWEHHSQILHMSSLNSRAAVSVLFPSAAATALNLKVTLEHLQDMIKLPSIHMDLTQLNTAQAWIQDWHLLKNFWETPCVYSRQAFIQIQLLFKDLRYNLLMDSAITGYVSVSSILQRKTSSVAFGYPCFTP